MPIEIRCPCGKRLKAPEKYAGRKLKCPACQQTLAVPAASLPVEDVRFVDDFDQDDQEPSTPPLATPQTPYNTFPVDFSGNRYSLMSSSKGLFKRIVIRDCLNSKVPT